MRFRSKLAAAAKGDRASLLAMALAILAVYGGERVGLLGGRLAPGHTQNTLSRLAKSLSSPESGFPAHPKLSRFSRCVLFSDFLDPLPSIAARLAPIASQVQKGHLVQIADPAEENFPYRGRTEFTEMAGTQNLTFGRPETLKENYQALYWPSVLRSRTSPAAWAGPSAFTIPTSRPTTCCCRSTCSWPTTSSGPNPTARVRHDRDPRFDRVCFPRCPVGVARLPVIWWLLRFTPPRPQRIAFPPFRLLRELMSTEEQPDRTPWWLILLRLVFAALIILAIARPMLGANDIGLGNARPLCCAR